MSISTQSCPGNQQQQQHHFRPTNPRLQLPPPLPSSGSRQSTSGEPFSNQLPNSHWTNSDRNTYPAAPQLVQQTHHEQQQQQVLTSQLFQKHQLITVGLPLKSSQS
jgi:hypothetical protein